MTSAWQLLQRYASRNRRSVIATSTSSKNFFSKSRPLAALLALLALVGMVALASSHDARPHAHDVEGAVHVLQLGEHHPGDEPPPGDPQPNDPIHTAAHVVLQGIAIPAVPLVGALLFTTVMLWGAGLAAPTRSIPPTAILRPPRR